MVSNWLVCVCVCVCVCMHTCVLSCSVVSNSLQPHELQPAGSSVHGDSPGKNTVEGCKALLQGIIPIQGLTPGLPHCRWILYHLSHGGSPRIVEWIAYLFSRGSSRPRNWTGVSCITGRFFPIWATREAPNWLLKVAESVKIFRRMDAWRGFPLMWVWLLTLSCLLKWK